MNLMYVCLAANLVSSTESYHLLACWPLYTPKKQHWKKTDRLVMWKARSSLVWTSERSFDRELKSLSTPCEMLGGRFLVCNRYLGVWIQTDRCSIGRCVYAWADWRFLILVRQGQLILQITNMSKIRPQRRNCRNNLPNCWLSHYRGFNPAESVASEVHQL